MAGEHDDIWRAIRSLQEEVKAIQRDMEDEQMAAAVQAGVNKAMRGKIVVPAGLLPRAIAVVAAGVAIAGGIKGLWG